MRVMAVVCPNCGYDFPEERKPAWPFWVKVGIPGLFSPSRSRSQALTLLGIGVLLGALSVVIALLDKYPLWGVIPITVWVLWCAVAIRWVDKHRAWPEGG
jgi:hypothetical protein